VNLSRLKLDSSPLRAEKPKEAQVPYSYDGLWTILNRVTGTIVLLFIATANFNLLGFFYFLLFLLHTFAYYSFRGKFQMI
jgi:hypothetical protein